MSSQIQGGSAPSKAARLLKTDGCDARRDWTPEDDQTPSDKFQFAFTLMQLLTLFSVLGLFEHIGFSSSFLEFNGSENQPNKQKNKHFLKLNMEQEHPTTRFEASTAAVRTRLSKSRFKRPLA